MSQEKSRKAFALIYTALCLFSAVTVAVYWVATPDGALYNAIACVWVATMGTALAMIALNRQAAWPAVVQGVLLAAYFSVHNLFEYAGAIEAEYSDGLYLNANCLLLVLVFAWGAFWGVYQLRRGTASAPRPLPAALRRAVAALHLACAAVLAVLGLDTVGLVYIEALEYLLFMGLFCGLVLVLAAFGVALVRADERTVVRRAGTAAFAAVAAVCAVAFGYQLETTLAASRANEAEANGLLFTSTRVADTTTDDGRRGLYEEDETLASTTYPTALSLAMAMCGVEMPKSNMVVTYDAGNWHEATDDGVVLMYDVYAPADATEATPVVINFHGYSATRQYYDTFALLVSMGYTVIDVEYGLDSESLNGGTANSPDGIASTPANYDWWVQDLEHLFRYLKAHEEELNIDLMCTFLYGHSGGACISAGVDNFLNGLGYEDASGNEVVGTYTQYAAYYEGAAADADVAEFVQVKGLILLYGIYGRYYASGMDPILFETGTADGVVEWDSARQIYYLRATCAIEHFYIMDAGASAHAYDNLGAYALSSQITNRYIELFVRRFGSA